MRESDTIHTVEPGEFLLGYPDNRGFFPPSPTIPASADPTNILPLIFPHHSRGPSSRISAIAVPMRIAISAATGRS